MESEPPQQVPKQEQKPETNPQTEKPMKKEKEPRKERKNEYEYNSDLITEETVIPQLPKKSQILKKPQLKDYKEKEKKNREKIDALIEEKKAIRQENFKAQRKVIKGDGEDNKYDVFSNEINDAKDMRERFNEVRAERDVFRSKLRTLITEAKENNITLKDCQTALKGSKENIFEKLQALENRLLTADLTKEEQKELNQEIMLTKRKVREAESAGNLEIVLAKAETRKDELDDEISEIKKEKEPLEAECDELAKKLDKKNEEISKIKGELSVENQERLDAKQRNNQEWEKWKEGKKLKQDKAEERIQALKKENDKIWDEYRQKQEQYWKQKHYIDFIEWQMKVKNRKATAKEREERKLAAIERDNLREKEHKLKRFALEIEQCNFLINYCKNMNDSQNEPENDEAKEEKLDPKAIEQKLSEDSQWKKEKGFEVVQSKKSKEDEEPVSKKGKKHKKKKQEKKTKQEFSIPYNVQNMFEELKILPPASLEELPNKVQELKDRADLFQRATKEDAVEDDLKLAQEIKELKEGVRKEVKVQKAKVESQEQEFPTL